MRKAQENLITIPQDLADVILDLHIMQLLRKPNRQVTVERLHKFSLTCKRIARLIDTQLARNKIKTAERSKLDSSTIELPRFNTIESK